MSRIIKQNKVFKNYFGSKNGSGVYQQIINQIRPHDVYMELFAGSGAIVQYKKPAERGSVVNDIDTNVFNRWLACSTDIPGCVPSGMCAISLLRNFEFIQEFRYCIYLDPPYPLSSRRSDREVYTYEMTDEQHRELLSLVCEISSTRYNVDFLISTYENEIYSELLAGWSLHKFKAQTRKGPAIECLYMNYENVGILHQYDYLGTDYIDRQRIKRKIEREVEKLKALPAAERQAILIAVAQLS